MSLIHGSLFEFALLCFNGAIESRISVHVESNRIAISSLSLNEKVSRDIAGEVSNAATNSEAVEGLIERC